MLGNLLEVVDHEQAGGGPLESVQMVVGFAIHRFEPRINGKAFPGGEFVLG